MQRFDSAINSPDNKYNYESNYVVIIDIFKEIQYKRHVASVAARHTVTVRFSNECTGTYNIDCHCSATSASMQYMRARISIRFESSYDVVHDGLVLPSPSPLLPLSLSLSLSRSLFCDERTVSEWYSRRCLYVKMQNATSLFRHPANEMAHSLLLFLNSHFLLPLL